MSTYGAIESITFVPLKDDRPTGQAFITYTQPTGVYLAIERANGMVLPTGDKLFVNHSRERNTSRQRSNSQLSASSYGQSGGGYRQPKSLKEFNPSHIRRQSFRNESFSFNNANRPLIQDTFISSVDCLEHHCADQNPTFNGIEHSILSTVSEITQKTLVLEIHASQMPLTSIENIPKNPARIGSQISLLQGAGIINNENSPIKNLKDQSSRKAQEGVGQKSGGRKITSRQNTSTNPSPTPSPIKSRSETKLNDMYSSQDARRFATKEDGYQTDQSVLKMSSIESSKPENSNQEKKNGSKKSNRKSHLKKKVSESSHNSDTPPQSIKSIDADEGTNSAISPTDSPTRSDYHPKNFKISFIHTSHQNPSIASRISHASVATTSKPEPSNSPTLEKPANQSFSKAKFGKCGKNSSGGSFDHQGEESTASIVSGPDSKTIIKDEAGSQSNAKIRPPTAPGLEKELPIPPSDYVNLRKEIQGKKDRAQDTLKEIRNIPSQSNTCQILKTHTKKSSNASATSNGSTHKVDLKPIKALVKDSKSQIGSIKSTDSLSSSGEPATPIRSESPTETIFMDPNHWPALGPSNSPQTAIADGKRPPPIAPTLRPAARKTPGATIVPAVPVIKKSRPQS
ncbi:hypothetical protein BGZ60DRAFT_154052 [Tricladium varicosporioides]|nr:hypothetical protein BGZ60DRAFT_154052 [Hymenoscyphus varicosporioides]